jgi:catechol 2,3-dioxygenase-like lactoylglutathione lyase family enzyme
LQLSEQYPSLSSAIKDAPQTAYQSAEPIQQDSQMKILQIDHLVLTVKDIEVTIAFYVRVLGLNHVIFDGHYHALHFGSQKINLHPAGNEYQPHAHTPVPGSGDLCFVASARIEDVMTELRLQGVEIEHGPCHRPARLAR